MSQITKSKIFVNKDVILTDYFNVKVMVTIIGTRMIAKKYIARYNIRRVSASIQKLKIIAITILILVLLKILRCDFAILIEKDECPAQIEAVPSYIP